MNCLKLYQVLSELVGTVAKTSGSILRHKLREPELWDERMGFVPEAVKRAAPYELWMHGVSVGEIGAVQAIAERLLEIRPGTRLVVSSFTASGIKRAREIFLDRIPVLAYPLDFPQPALSVVEAVKPLVYCCVETELWPNLLTSLGAAGIKALLMNARISERSFNSYMRLRFLFGPVLRKFQHICTISTIHRERLLSLGADRNCIEVTGNAKYEYLLDRPDRNRAERLKSRLGIDAKRPVFLAGSIRGQECKMVTEVAEALMATGLEAFVILVPRHLERVQEIRDFLTGRGIRYHTLKEIMEEGDNGRDTDCLVVDEIGRLFDLYGVCDAAFVGGSLVRLGGQNLMEPAAWSRPVVFGPHVKNFQEAASALLETGGGVRVENTGELMRVLKGLLQDRMRAEETGQKARRALERVAEGAATRQAQCIAGYLDAAAGSWFHE